MRFDEIFLDNKNRVAKSETFFFSFNFSAHGDPVSERLNTTKILERYKRQLSSEELLNLSPEELCKDRLSEEYFRLTTEGDCRDVVR